MKNPFLTPPTIHIAESVLRGFRRRAWRSYPDEYLEIFFGRREHSNVYVTALIHVEQNAGSDWVQIADDEIEEMVKGEAREHKLKVVGSIHTHPVLKRDPEWLREVNHHMSRTDHASSAEAGELISAVMPMWVTPSGRKRSSIAWWVPQQRLEVKRCR